jgi:hypothetical protein
MCPVGGACLCSSPYSPIFIHPGCGLHAATGTKRSGHFYRIKERVAIQRCVKHQIPRRAAPARFSVSLRPARAAARPVVYSNMGGPWGRPRTAIFWPISAPAYLTIAHPACASACNKGSSLFGVLRSRLFEFPFWSRYPFASPRFSSGSDLPSFVGPRLT